MLETLQAEQADVSMWMQSRAALCRALPLADEQTRPLRDCITYYNGHGEAEAGSLAYYGGGRWHKIRERAQASLEPYRFERRASGETASK